MAGSKGIVIDDYVYRILMLDPEVVPFRSFASGPIEVPDYIVQQVFSAVVQDGAGSR